MNRLSNAHGSICCLHDLSTTEFLLSQCPNVKRFFSSETACSQTSSPPPAMSSTATPMIPWYLCCEPLSTKTHGSKTDVSKPSPLAVARKQFLHSLVPTASPLTVLSSYTRTSRDSPGTPSGGILTKSGSSLLLMMSRALARRSGGLLSSGFRTGPTSVHRTIRPARSSLGRFFFQGQYPGCLVLEQGLPLDLHAPQKLTFLCSFFCDPAWFLNRMARCGDW